MDKVALRCLKDKDSCLIQDPYGRNMGMIAAQNKMENVVLEALDNYELSTQVDEFNRNIAMYAAINKLEKSVIKSFRNLDASLQEDSDGKIAAFLAVENGLEKAGLEAIQIPKIARYINLSNNCKNLAMVAADNNMDSIIIKAIDIGREAGIYDTDTVGDTAAMTAVLKRRKAVAQRAIQDEKLCMIENRNNKTLPMLCVKAGFEDVVLEALDNKNIAKYLNREGYNLGEFATINGLEKASMKAMDNPDTLLHISNCQNIGMYAAKKGLKNAVRKALSIEKLANQVVGGRNVGIATAIWAGYWSGIHDLEDEVILALQNPVASIQQDLQGKNMGMYAAEGGLINATMIALDNVVASSQRTPNGQDILYFAEKKRVCDFDTGMDEVIVKGLRQVKDIETRDNHYTYCYAKSLTGQDPVVDKNLEQIVEFEKNKYENGQVTARQLSAMYRNNEIDFGEDDEDFYDDEDFDMFF